MATQADSAQTGAAGGGAAGEPGAGAHATGGARDVDADAGVAAAVKAVAADVTALAKAELDLAKAELAQGVKAKATGFGMLVGTAVLGWLALQGLLITAALALALVLPGWAAALIVSAVLLLIAGILALVARPKLRSPVGVSMTKTQVQEDVDWTKEQLDAPQTKQQVQEDITWTRQRLIRR